MIYQTDQAIPTVVPVIVRIIQSTIDHLSSIYPTLYQRKYHKPV